MATIDWKGKELLTRVAAAAAAGVDATMADAVAKARANHPGYPPASRPGQRFASRTGFLENSIVISSEAKPDGLKVRGRWAAEANYALYVEIGTSRLGSGAPRAREREALGGEVMWAVPGPAHPALMAARFTLRPAASEAYRLLPARIAAVFRGTGG